MSHWAHLNFYPEPILQLQKELIHHPVLQQDLARHPAHEWEIRLAQIALYCEVLLDGDYTEENLVKLCEILNSSDLVSGEVDSVTGEVQSGIILR
jgi:hypothetical protein